MAVPPCTVARTLAPISLSHCLAGRYFDGVRQMQSLAESMHHMGAMHLRAINERMSAIGV